MTSTPVPVFTESYVTTDDGCRLWTARCEQSGSTSSGEGAPSRSTRGASTDPESDADADAGFVLCHGGPGFWDTLAPLAVLLAGRGPVIRWDQRGGGRSRHQGPYTLARFVADLDAVRAAHGLERVTVVGHSWGANLALHYALNHPERTRSLVYVAGVGLSWDWRPRHNANFLAAMAPHAAEFAALTALDQPTEEQEREADVLRLMTDFPDPATAREHAEQLLSPYFVSDPEVNRLLVAEVRTLTEADMIARCRALPVSMRVLVVDGARDPRPRWSVDSLADALPNVTRVTLESAGHLPWIDEPDAFTDALHAFVA
ncbi:MAG TPA: alpha/beta hydrolase [Actinocrinis sp.]|uniref:alpha/beta fold hydrolase n=1 Tax=Actinocrinis sp. TaxID=1920516 RepID=UPI002DDD943B|nr:alpha/beta hydrolase [Actinocrinis sp.]HEV2346009.1 alpha/beta hydrolase [Actinocrinis sp.]